MNHMFNDLSTKYDNVTSHMHQMDVQIAQTAESVKRQHGTLPGKTDKNPKECNVVALRSGRNLPDAIPKKLSAAEKGKQKEGEQPRSETPPLSDEEPEQSAETDLTHVAPPVEPVPPREYTPKVPYPVPAKTSRKDREETKCKKMLEDLTIKLPLEILTDDPLELALIRSATEHNVMSVDADGYEKMLDSAKIMEILVTYLSLGEKDESNQSDTSGASAGTKLRISRLDIDRWYRMYID
ncbi:hypothetical protein DY000_02040252 [Brassica cretica]|uniref:NET domain-containing protein n=1 Tax=Brassica cretica TaxID=69181 RepID=A0ABQ7BPW0_BRACR|nr:hypothetical protein DY000_02040252 [Brassica cretica]